jgi:predicted O-methyltransferase YrrM
LTPPITDDAASNDADGLSGALEAAVRASDNRSELWCTLLNAIGARHVAEIGVYRGNFAAELLSCCPGVETYYMIDPWRHLEDWNKPANRDDETFARIFEEAMSRTHDYARKRVVLRGRTSEVMTRIPDDSLDFVYIDGDHSLRGITIDLLHSYPKVRHGGWIAGDDFSPSIWQHGPRFEPTLVFPFAVYFAESLGLRIFGLPHNQFLIENRAESGYEFRDLTNRYRHRDLRTQTSPRTKRKADRPTKTAFLRRLRRLSSAWRFSLLRTRHPGR